MTAIQNLHRSLANTSVEDMLLDKHGSVLGDGSDGGTAVLMTAPEELEANKEEPGIGDMIADTNHSIVPHSRKLAADLPWRERAELFGLNKDREVLGGTYQEDKTHGVLGGGIEEGESVEEGALRELLEESGYTGTGAHVLPVNPVETPWNPPYSTPAQEARAKRYRGSRTHFVGADIVPGGPGEVAEPSSLQDLRFRPLGDAIALTDLNKARYREMAQARRSSLEHLLKSSSTLAQARKQVDTNPTDGQIEAGNYAKGHTTLHSLPITLENPKGSTRSGVDPGGKSWSQVMRHDYGYINRTEGKDGDHVDVFIGPDPTTELIFVVNQKVGGKFDEHKCLLGFATEEKAKAGYLANYAKGWKGLGSIYPLTVPQFKWWLEHGDQTKPVKDGTFAKKAEDSSQFVHYSPDKIDQPRSLTYDELAKNRTRGRWENEPDKAQTYVDDRRKTEDAYREKLRGVGVEHGPDQSFLYATMKGRERFDPGKEHNSYDVNLSPEDIEKTLFDLVGLPEDQLHPDGPQLGQVGLDAATKLWDENQESLADTEHMGMPIRPRIEVITPGVKKAEDVTGDDLQDFFDSPPNKKGRKCPGCGELFKEVEPYADVENCEACERYGPPKSEKVGTSAHPPTVAVDMDGTLAVHYEKFDADHIPDPRPGAKKQMESFRDAGARIIIFTVRGKDSVTKAWLDKHDIPYDHINENPDQPPGASGKVFADVYWDDRAVSADGDLADSGPEVLKRLTKTKTAALDGMYSFAANAIPQPPPQPYWQAGLANQIKQPTWNSKKPFFSNMATNLQQAKDHAAAKIRDKDFITKFRSDLEPGFAYQNMQRFLREGDHVKSPVDRLLFRGGL